MGVLVCLIDELGCVRVDKEGEGVCDFYVLGGEVCVCGDVFVLVKPVEIHFVCAIKIYICVVRQGTYLKPLLQLRNGFEERDNSEARHARGVAHGARAGGEKSGEEGGCRCCRCVECGRVRERVRKDRGYGHGSPTLYPIYPSIHRHTHAHAPATTPKKS